MTASKGGYLTFCEYHVNNDRFLGVFLIRDTEGLIFNRDRENNAVQIDTITYLDTNKLAMGCRINYSKYIINSGKYLTFMRRQTTMSEYFLNWVAAAQPESSKEFTQTLYRMITQMPKPIDPDTNEEYDTNKFRDKAKEVIKDNNGNVNLELIGNYFYEDENALINYRDENNFELDNEFRADKRELNKFSQVDIKGEGIHLKFSRGDLGTGKVRTGQQNHIVIESQRLYEALIEEERENG